MILKPTCFKSLFPYSLLKVLWTFNLRPVSTGIYKTFVRPQLDHGDILCEKAYNSSFHQKIECGQYNRCLAITCAIRGTSKEVLQWARSRVPSTLSLIQKVALLSQILQTRSSSVSFQISSFNPIMTEAVII